MINYSKCKPSTYFYVCIIYACNSKLLTIEVLFEAFTHTIMSLDSDSVDPPAKK